MEKSQFDSLICDIVHAVYLLGNFSWEEYGNRLQKNVFFLFLGQKHFLRLISIDSGIGWD